MISDTIYSKASQRLGQWRNLGPRRPRCAGGGGGGTVYEKGPYETYMFFRKYIRSKKHMFFEKIYMFFEKVYMFFEKVYIF